MEVQEPHKAGPPPFRREAAIETLRELDRRGYMLGAKTERRTHEHHAGPQHITYATKLLVTGGPVADGLRDMVRRHQSYLLAAACVRMPPVQWLEILVSRYRAGRIPLRSLAANVAAFVGKHPAHHGPEFEPIIKEVLG